MEFALKMAPFQVLAQTQSVGSAEGKRLDSALLKVEVIRQHKGTEAMLLPRFLSNLWGSLNGVCGGFAPRGCLQLSLFLLITTRQSNNHLIAVTHLYTYCG